MTKHLSTLSILHYIYGAFVAVMGIVLPFIFIGLGAFLSSDFVLEQAQEPPPPFVAAMFRWMGWVMLAVFLGWGALIALSGRWIARRKNRTASLVIAALCLLSFPLGTALGIFTFVVLLNEEVRQAYEAAVARA
jgi:MFS family permease